MVVIFVLHHHSPINASEAIVNVLTGYHAMDIAPNNAE
jgi:hypothetical protein